MAPDIDTTRVSNTTPQGHREDGIEAEVLSDAGHCVWQGRLEALDGIGDLVVSERAQVCLDFLLHSSQHLGVLHKVPEKEGQGP